MAGPRYPAAPHLPGLTWAQVGESSCWLWLPEWTCSSPWPSSSSHRLRQLPGRPSCQKNFFPSLSYLEKKSLFTVFYSPRLQRQRQPPAAPLMPAVKGEGGLGAGGGKKKGVRSPQARSPRDPHDACGEKQQASSFPSSLFLISPSSSAVHRLFLSRAVCVSVYARVCVCTQGRRISSALRLGFGRLSSPRSC